MLPSTSRVFIAINPDNAITLDQRLLELIEYWSHLSAWQNTSDGTKGRNVPEFVLGTSTRNNDDALSLDVDEYQEILSKPRKEVSNGDGVS